MGKKLFLCRLKPFDIACPFENRNLAMAWWKDNESLEKHWKEFYGLPARREVKVVRWDMLDEAPGFRKTKAELDLENKEKKELSKIRLAVDNTGGTLPPRVDTWLGRQVNGTIFRVVDKTDQTNFLTTKFRLDSKTERVATLYTYNLQCPTIEVEMTRFSNKFDLVEILGIFCTEETEQVEEDKEE